MKLFRYIFLLGFLCFSIGSLNAAPFEIEGVIKQVRKIDVTGPYIFKGKEVVSVYVVGHRFGKDFDYQYMVVKDSTELDGISFDELHPGRYVRIKSRAEPPGMVGKPLNDIRASRYGCCNYALHIDTVKTPVTIKGKLLDVVKKKNDNKILTLKKNGQIYEYLVINGNTEFLDGTYESLNKGVKVEVLSAGINIPVPQGKDHGALLGSDLFVYKIKVMD